MNCERCGAETDKLYDFNYVDEDNPDEKQTMKVCWDCDHNIINGGDPFEDSWEVLQDRAENDYEYDPINNPRPW